MGVGLECVAGEGERGGRGRREKRKSKMHNVLIDIIIILPSYIMLFSSIPSPDKCLTLFFLLFMIYADSDTVTTIIRTTITPAKLLLASIIILEVTFENSTADSIPSVVLGITEVFSKRKKFFLTQVV